MYWLLIPAVLFFFRGRIATFLAPYLGTDPKKTNFYGHLLIVIAALVYLLPLEFVGLEGVKRMAYLMALWAQIMVAGFTITVNYRDKMPDLPTSGFSMAAMKATMARAQPWLQEVISGVDFHFLFFALIFLAATPSVIVLGILGRRSLWSVATYCSKNTPENKLWVKFLPTWTQLKAKEKQVLFCSSLAEVCLGLFLTVQIFTASRQIITCLLYWNYLRTRYQVPRSHPQHLEAWQFLGMKVQPILRMVPPLNIPLNYAKNWFQPQYQQAGGG